MWFVSFLLLIVLFDSSSLIYYALAKIFSQSVAYVLPLLVEKGIKKFYIL